MSALADLARARPGGARAQRPVLAPLLAGILALGAPAGQAAAQAGSRTDRTSAAQDEREDRMRPQAGDAGQPTPSRWRFQRRFEFEAEQERNYRLDRSDPRRRTDIEPMLRLGATWRGTPHLLGFVEVEALVHHRDDRGEPGRTDGRLHVNQAYVALAGWIDDTELRLGRWLYRDEREWLFDESLDGVYARRDFGAIEVDGLLGRVNYFRRDLFDSATRGDPVNVYGVLARAAVRRRFELGAYAVASHDTAGAGGRQRNVGVRAHGRIGDWLHWTELGIVEGHAGPARLRGRAFDIGGVYTVSAWPMQPRATLGYAWGSGDGDARDGVDRRYRQTGLQSNEARLGGLYKRRIYGAVLDPELSNLRVLSAGLGISPTPRWSIDLVWFGYTQDQVAPVEHAEVRSRRDSLDRRHLGNELNLVVGYAPSRSIIVGAVLGWHRPSQRFERDASGRERDPGVAIYGGLEVKASF